MFLSLCRPTCLPSPCCWHFLVSAYYLQVINLFLYMLKIFAMRE